MTSQQAWCVVGDELKDGLELQLKNWGWTCNFVERPVDIFQKDKHILSPDDVWIEDWALKALDSLPPDGTPLLIVQSELMPKNRAGGHGVLLSERVWSSRVVPTVLATVNPRAGQRRNIRRIRLSSGRPLLRVIWTGDTASTEQPDLVLWDILSGQDEFTKSIELAHETSALSNRPNKPGPDKRSISERLHNAAVAMQTAVSRHSLKGFTSSLRIMEGAFLCNWLSEQEVNKMLGDLIGLSGGNAQRIELLNKLQGRIKNFVRQNRPPKAHHRISQRLRVAVCDDDWQRAGWNNLIKPLLDARFGLDVEGYSSQMQLLHALSTTPDREKIVTLLLDVHYEDNGVETARVDRQFLRDLREQYPLLDVILFTSDLRDGALVREAYERGYRIFFKELDEAGRVPEQDARKFIQVVEDSVGTFPVRALQQVMEAGLADPGADDVTPVLMEAIATWRRDAQPAMVFNLAALLEREYRISYAHVSGKKMNPNTSVGWTALADKCDPQSEAVQTWMRFAKLATTTRNSLLHNAGLVMEADSTLPSLGLAIPLVIAITSAHRIFTPDSNPNRQAAIFLSLKELCRAIYLSDQMKRRESRKVLETAVQNLSSGKAGKVYQDLCKLSAKNEKLFGKVSPSKGSTSLASCLHDKELFIEPIIEVNGKKVNCQLSLSTYQLTCVLALICVLDHAEATF